MSRAASDTRPVTPTTVRCANCGNPTPVPVGGNKQLTVCGDCGEPVVAKDPFKGFQWGVLIPMGLVLLAIGLCLFFWDFQKANHFKEHGTETVAQVIEFREHTRQNVTVPQYRYRFHAASSGEWFTRQNLFGLSEQWSYLDGHSLPELQSSGQVLVKYDSEDPTLNAPVGTPDADVFMMLYARSGLCGVIGILLILKSIQWRSNRRRAY